VAFVPASSLAPATVTVAGTVAVSNFPADQGVHFTSPQHAIVDSGAVTVSGSVNVGNVPHVIVDSGSVNVGNFPADQLVHFSAVQHVIVDSGSITVSGTATVSGTVNVGNFPATYPVTQSTTPWVVDGSAVTQPVSVSTLPLPAGAATDSTLAAVQRAADDIALTAMLERDKVTE
jgi:hypothetical protein